MRDLLAHMVGLGADVLAGNEPDDHPADWTRAQVAARAGRGVAVLLDALAARPDLPPLALEEEPGPGRVPWHWCSSGEPADAAVVLRAPGFDLFRALTSRRTAAQLRGWSVRGDVSDHLEAFAGLGPLPLTPLPE